MRLYFYESFLNSIDGFTRFSLGLFGAVFCVFLTTPNLQAQTKGMLALSSSPSGTERRIALVIGNKNYVRPDAALKNPINDADDMAKTLDGLGFDVLKYTDLSFTGFKRAIDEFGEKLPNYDVALFYFSGHGVQFNGENYLVPVDARLQTLSDSEDDCIRLGRIMGKMKAADVKNSLVFLDACRNNPFPKSSARGVVSAGLNIPNNPAGSVVVFATEEGSTADDNMQERNGLFTSELLRHLPVPNVSLSDIILRTRQGVYERSGKNQLPSDYNKMLGNFYFVKRYDSMDQIKGTEAKEVLDLPVESLIQMVLVKGGTFRMGDIKNEGDSNERPVHLVTVDSFRIGKYEVTQSQWLDIMGYNPSKFSTCSSCPVERVSWYEAIEFCNRLSDRERRQRVYSIADTSVTVNWNTNGYRLPTEAEWEYAAGGGMTNRTRFGNGQDILAPSEANFDARFSSKMPYSNVGDFRGRTVEVGSFRPNILGLYDMVGNVSEWCWDWEGPYSSNSERNPKGLSVGTHRICRGSSWVNAPHVSRVASRYFKIPNSGGNSMIGFRVVTQK